MTSCFKIGHRFSQMYADDYLAYILIIVRLSAHDEVCVYPHPKQVNI